jgi:hypothetical protein
MLDPAMAIATSALMSAVLLVLLGSLLRSGIPGVLEWFAANVATVVALPLFLMRFRIPDTLSVVAANMLMAWAAVAYYAGCARFLGRPAHWPVLMVSFCRWESRSSTGAMRSTAFRFVYSSPRCSLLRFASRSRFWCSGTARPDARPIPIA